MELGVSFYLYAFFLLPLLVEGGFLWSNVSKSFFDDDFSGWLFSGLLCVYIRVMC
jgi:hypothetical protein